MHEVVRVIPLENYCILAEFENGEKRIADIKPLLVKPTFKALENERLFKSVYVQYGAPTWKKADGYELDICPDKLYMDSKSVDERGTA